MDSTRRELLVSTGKLLLLTGAAGLAWEHVLAGTPELAPNYDRSRHWWAMLMDIDKCIGCGKCVRACKDENDVPKDPRFFRTWVERYQVPPVDPRDPQRESLPIVDSPNGGYDGFPDVGAAAAGAKTFFVPKMCNHCAHSPCTQVCPVGATFESEDGVVLRQGLLPWLPLLRAGLPLRLPLHRPPHEHRRQVHAVLPPDHQGAHHRVLRGLPHRSAAARRPQEPGRSHP